MTLPISIKVKVLPRFPARVIGRTAIKVTKTNGIFYFDIDYADMTPVASVPPGAVPYTLVWDIVTGTYILLPLSSFTYTEAPNDGFSYGRNSLAWARVVPLSGGTMTGSLVLNADPAAALGAATKQYVDTHSGAGLGDAPSDGNYYARVNATWGSLGLPGTIAENSQSANYTTVLADAGKFIYHPATDNNARTFTIAANASVAYAIGTVISFVNMINTLTIAIATDTMTLAGTGTTGSRTLAANGCCTAMKIGTTAWIISGTGLT